jgi:hypothetical protein
MRSLILPALMLALPVTLSSCGEPAEQPVAVSNANAPETGAAAQVAALTDDLRNGVFAKAIRDGGVACPEVTGAERAEITPGVKGWRAHCNNDSAHLIQILPDGTAKVTSRTH